MELPDFKLDPQRVYEAIRAGVREAVWSAIINATQRPTADFYDAVKQGVREATLEMIGDEGEEGSE